MSQNLIGKLHSYIEFNEDEERGLVIIGNSGLAAPLLIHWGTAVYMAVVATFLLRRKKT